MKNWVQRIIKRIKQFRLVGYIIIGIEMYKTQGIEKTLPTLFLLIVLSEVSIRNKKKK